MRLNLCSKELKVRTTRSLKFIKKTNRALRLISQGQLITAPIPGVNLKTKVATKTLKKALKFSQLIEKNTFAFKKNQLIRKHRCRLWSQVGSHHLHGSFFSISRNKWDEAIFKKKRWSQVVKKGGFSLKTHFNVSTQKAQDFPVKDRHFPSLF